MQHTIDVLVVDDDAAAASDFAELIKVRLGIRAVSTSDPFQALELARSSAIKVYVIDIRMPRMQGTDLFQSIREIDPRARGVVMTGQATRDEVGAALGAGFNSYLAKEEVVDRLPDQVRHEFTAYERSVAAELQTRQGEVLLRKRGHWSLRRSVVFRLMNAAIIDEEYVPDTAWTDVVSLHAGQTERRLISANVSAGLTLETETTSRLTSHLGLSAKQVLALRAHLESELSQRFKLVEQSSTSLSAGQETTFALPQEPMDPGLPHVRMRKIQQAPLARRWRLEVAVDCASCGIPSVLVAEALTPKQVVVTRHVDFLSDGTQRVHQLGPVRG